MSLENHPHFKKAFWEWFDNLPLKEKEKFWWFKIDMATTYFYNAIYTKTAFKRNCKVVKQLSKEVVSPSSPIGRGA